METGKPFWIVWSPDGKTPPKVKHRSEPAANMVAKEMAKKHSLGECFFVLRAERAYQMQSKVEQFTFGCSTYTRPEDQWPSHMVLISLEEYKRLTKVDQNEKARQAAKRQKGQKAAKKAARRPVRGEAEDPL